MPVLNFPQGPTDGQVYAPNGLSNDHWTWSATGNYWRIDEVEVSTLDGLSGHIDLQGSGSVTIGRSGQTITIDASVGGGPGGSFVETLNGRTGPIEFDTGQFEYDSASNKFILNPDYFKKSISTTDGLLFRSPVSTETNRIGLLSSGATSAVNFAETVGNQVTTTSVSPVLLVQGYQSKETYGNIGGATATIVSVRYFNAADVTVYAYRGDNAGSTIRKFMILDELGVTSNYSEYADISRGSTVATFAVQATAGSWGLYATPSATASTVFSVRSTLYKGVPEVQ